MNSVVVNQSNRSVLKFQLRKMSLKFVIFSVLLASALAGKFCENFDCEEYQDYPFDILNSLDLWKYKFPEQKVDDQKRHKRDEQDEDFVETNLCGSIKRTIQPKILNNKLNTSKVVVNHANYTQFLRIEECLNPMSSCALDVYPNTIKSRCSQKHMEITLWTLNDQNRSLVKENFFYPSSCNCVILKKQTFLD